MNILAFDNSTSTCVVALLHGDKTLVLSKTAAKSQAKLILPLIDELLSSTQLKLSDLDAIAYGCGPGSFTGVRIASSVAQALGYAAKIPLLAISSLAALAQTAYLNHPEKMHILTALDARMAQVHWAHYRVHDQLVRIQGKEQTACPEDLKFLSEANTATYLGVGDAWAKYTQLPCRPTHIEEGLTPSGEALLQLAKSVYYDHEKLHLMSAFPSQAAP